MRRIRRVAAPPDGAAARARVPLVSSKNKRQSRPRPAAARTRPKTLRGAPHARPQSELQWGRVGACACAGGAGEGRPVCECEWGVRLSIRAYVFKLTFLNWVLRFFSWWRSAKLFDRS
jgi:hypothetical protein